VPKDFDKVFGMPDLAIQVQRLDRLGKVERVIVDRDHDNIFWISADKISDSSEPPVQRPLGSLAAPPAGVEGPLKEFFKYLPSLSAFGH